MSSGKNTRELRRGYLRGWFRVTIASFVLLVLLVLLVVLLGFLFPSRTIIGSFRGISGEVQVERGARPVDGYEGMTLLSGDGVHLYGESGTVRLSDGSTLCLAAGTTVELVAAPSPATASGVRVRLDSGRIIAQVVDQPSGAPLAIATSHAEVLTRGAIFTLESDADDDDLSVRAGVVSLHPRNGKMMGIHAGGRVRTDGKGTSRPPALLVLHVAPAGDDAGPGSLARPLHSIARASTLLSAGGVCIIHAGTYRETIRPPQAGSITHPITYRAAGDGPVVIDGSDVVSGWSAQPGGLWSAALAWDLGPGRNQVFCDGILLPEASFPHRPGASRSPLLTPMTPDPDGTGMLVPACTQPPGVWVGARAWGLIGPRSCSQTARVVASEPGRLRLAGGSTPWSLSNAGRPDRNGGIVLVGVRAACTEPGDWLIADGHVLLLPFTPGGLLRHIITIKHRSVLADLSLSQGIRLSGLDFVAGTLVMSGSFCQVEDCRFREVSQEPGNGHDGSGGIRIAGVGNRLERCTIDGSSGSGIVVAGEDNTVRSCIVCNTDRSGDASAAVVMAGRRNVLQHCSLSHSGGVLCAVRCSGQDKVLANDMAHGGEVTDDGGLVTAGDCDGAGTQIAYNLIHGERRAQEGPGILLADGSRNFSIHHNCVWDCACGICLSTVIHPSSGLRLDNNTLWHNLNGGVITIGDQAQDELQVANNLTDAAPDWVLAHGDNLRLDDAHFVNAASGDFRLLVSSPAIGRGHSIPGLMDGPSGHPVDVGAHELGAPSWNAGAQPRSESPMITVSPVPSGLLITVTASPGAWIRCTSDGSLPDEDTARYDKPCIVDRSAIITAVAGGQGREWSLPTTRICAYQR